MANLKVKDGLGAEKHLKTSGAGTDGDPHIPEHTISGTVAVSAAALPLPSGAATAANQVTAIGHLATIAGVAGDALTDAELRASAVPVSGSVTVSGTVAVTGVATAANQSTEIGHLATLAGAVAGTEVQADIVSLPNVTIGAAIPAGTNNIGDVDVLTLPALPAGTNNIGDVDVLSIAAGTNTIGATRDAGPAWTSAFGVSSARVTSADATGIVAVTDAPTSGQKIVIDDVIISVGATAMLCDLQEETTTTKLISIYMAANSTVQITPRGKIKLATADKKLCIDTSAAGNVAVTAIYHSEA